MPWTRATKLLLALCAGLYAFHLFHVWRNAVDLPVADEWEVFNPGQLPAGLTPGWLFFFLLSARLLFSPAQRTRALAAGCLFSALSVFSLASGVVSAVVLLLAFAAFKASRALKAGGGEARGAELCQLLLVTLFVGGTVALWLSLFLAFLNNWRFRDYRIERAARLRGVECVRDYYLRGGGLCPEVYPAPLGRRLDAARELDAAFYRDLRVSAGGGRAR
jgi:hypothetical protein